MRTGNLLSTLLVFASFAAVLQLAASVAQASGPPSTSPLFQWNFDTDTGTTVNNTGALPGGTLTAVAPVVLGSAGSGSSGAPTDIAIDAQSGVYNSAASGIVASSTGNVSAGPLSKLTITGWLKDTAFSNYIDNGTPRILTIGPAGYDGGSGTSGSLQLRVFNGTYKGSDYFGELQFKVNGAGGSDDLNGVVSTVVNQDFTGILPATNAWTFFAVTYNADLTNLHTSVSMYIGDNVAAHNLGPAAFTGAYPANSGVPLSTPGAVQFDSAFTYLLNSPNQSKAYTGLGDDFRLYGAVLTQSQLNRVRLGLPLAIPGDWNLDGTDTAADVPAMLTALADLNKYQMDNNLATDDLLLIGDLTGDGSVTNLDIQPELDLISATGAGSLAAVPEPATSTLFLGGFIVFGVACFGGRKKFPHHFGGNQHKVLASVVGPH